MATEYWYLSTPLAFKEKELKGCVTREELEKAIEKYSPYFPNGGFEDIELEASYSSEKRVVRTYKEYLNLRKQGWR